jgi:excisionase family DNA binding protein
VREEEEERHMANGEMERDEILTSKEAQRLLKIGRTKLWALTKDGSLPAYRIGDGKTSALRYKKAELIQWLDANRILARKD